jgi:hypothetical protein
MSQCEATEGVEMPGVKFLPFVTFDILCFSHAEIGVSPQWVGKTLDGCQARLEERQARPEQTVPERRLLERPQKR